MSLRKNWADFWVIDSKKLPWFQRGSHMCLSTTHIWPYRHPRGHVNSFFSISEPNITQSHIAIWHDEFYGSVSCLVWLAISSQSDLWTCKWACLLGGDVLPMPSRSWSSDCVGVRQSLTADTGTELAEIHRARRRDGLHRFSRWLMGWRQNLAEPDKCQANRHPEIEAQRQTLSTHK